VVLRPKPPNPPREVYLLCLLHDFYKCHCRPRLPDHQVFQRLCLTWSTTILTWSTWSSPLVLLLVDVPKYQTLMVSLPTILVPPLKPHVRPSPLPVHRNDTSLLDLLHIRRPSLCSSPTHQHSKRHVAHTLTYQTAGLLFIIKMDGSARIHSVRTKH
jgi:hypothetical protein